ncbi:AraC family transcriptional regulator [Chitinivorax sp. PXF-14]|uniref:AraC family transcriptional regulator n=1 Tax=Chitinivorax sp. PXF-14 TaxID=3230488 RepID=UPI003466CDCE
MSGSDYPLPGFYIRQIAEQIQASGGDVGQWLAQNGMTLAQLIDPSLQPAFPQVQQLVRDALAITGEPALGLLVGARLPPNAHGILGYAAMNSGTLREAFELIERYLPVRTTLVNVRHMAHGDEMRLVFEEKLPLDDIARPVLEAVVLTFARLLEAVSAGACRVRVVAFPFAAPDYAALADEMFACPVRYGQDWAGYAFPLAEVDQPLKMADPNAFAEAVAICQRELEKLTRSASLSTRVRRLLLEANGNFPSLAVAARLLYMTQRTLHRHLLQEGTSFKAILEDVRRTRAIEHLKAGNISIQEIAYTLGYTDLANFRRAFKRWEGVPPSEYGKAQQARKAG